MKTVLKIQEEENKITNEAEELKKLNTIEGAKKITRIKKRLQYLRQIKMYLSTNPTKEFCEKERDRLSNRINSFLLAYNPPNNIDKLTKKDITKHAKDYEREMGIPKIRKQLTNLNFILK